MTTRLQVVRSILFERKLSGLPGFNLRGLSMEVEARWGSIVLEDTCRKEADLLKPEIPFVRAGKGIRRFVAEYEQGQLFG